mgnify:CR=1 FL=1
MIKSFIALLGGFYEYFQLSNNIFLTHKIFQALWSQSTVKFLFFGQ